MGTVSGICLFWKNILSLYSCFCVYFSSVLFCVEILFSDMPSLMTYKSIWKIRISTFWNNQKQLVQYSLFLRHWYLNLVFDCMPVLLVPDEVWKSFILVMTRNCLQQMVFTETVDWWLSVYYTIRHVFSGYIFYWKSGSFTHKVNSAELTFTNHVLWSANFCCLATSQKCQRWRVFPWCRFHKDLRYRL